MSQEVCRKNIGSARKEWKCVYKTGTAFELYEVSNLLLLSLVIRTYSNYSHSYLLPLEWTTTFIPLQDKCPVSSYESIQEMFIKDTGRRIEDDFDDFSKEPLGSASLAQVHTAMLKNSNQKVAVKVQHPTLEAWAP